MRKQPAPSQMAAESFYIQASMVRMHITRALLNFDVNSAGIPPGSTITGATLRLLDNTQKNRSDTIRLYRLSQDWGEGASDAPDGEGGGTAAQPNDATWLHTFFSTDTWTTPGGDFNPSHSAELADHKSGSEGYHLIPACRGCRRHAREPCGQFWMDHTSDERNH